MKLQHRLSLFTFFTATLLLVGCSKPTGDLSGSVKYKGKAVVAGTVTVFDAEKKAYQGGIDQGQYTVKNVPEGPVEIIVSSPNPNSVGQTGSKLPDRGQGLKDTRPPREGGDPAAPQLTVTGWFPIPTKYEDAKTSPLKTTIKAGANPYDIDLKD